MWSWRCPERGFTLIELAVALLVLALLASAVALPVAAQLQSRRQDEARRQLDDARDALLGYAAAHGRLPCPASAASRGEEAFAPGGDAANGECERFHDGFLPAAALGLAGLDAEGFLRDPWGTPAGRVRYAVADVAVAGITRPFTRVNGMQRAGLAALGDANRLLVVCGSGDAATATSCGPASAQLTRKAVFVLLSPGPGAARGEPAGPDEARNLDADAVFVSHEASSIAGRQYDDLLTWASLPLVTQRLLAAGRLP